MAHFKSEGGKETTMSTSTVRNNYAWLRKKVGRNLNEVIPTKSVS